MAGQLIQRRRRKAHDPRTEVIKTLVDHGRQLRRRRKAAEAPRPEVGDWAAKNFYVTDGEGQAHLIELAPHQAAVLRFIFQRQPNGRYRYSTVVWSTVKKSGKTTISSLVARWATETWGRFPEVYCLANDYEQAKSRAFKSMAESIELTPGYDKQRRFLPGRWIIQEKSLRYIPSGGAIKAVANDYRGEAGSNPSLTLWTELWAYVSEASKRLWTEMTPSPTRPTSMRWVETYAGFEGESELLEGLYNLGRDPEQGGRQITAGELGDLDAFEESPNADDLVPVWVNEEAGLVMYWDDGITARRMTWQRGEAGSEYYREQERTLRTHEFNRLHLNLWSGGESEFVPLSWWDACLDSMPLVTGDMIPLVGAADASVSGDCTAFVVVSRHPQAKARPELRDHICVRYVRAWKPALQPGMVMDYEATLNPEVDWMKNHHNFLWLAYDPYQLHQWALNGSRASQLPVYFEFNQGTPRLLADKGLFDLIRDRKLHQNGDPELRQHIQNAIVKHQASATEDSKLRLDKKSGGRKIDLVVALSMAAAECLRLNL